MNIIRRRRVQTDDWRHAAEGEPLGDGDLIVPLARWPEARESLRSRRGRIGVRLGPGETIEPLLAHLDALSLVAFELASFADGRPYTHARLLRERHGFSGEIRACGDVFRDQLLALERCGFDAFELRAGEEPAQALDAFAEISVRFQPAVDGPGGGAHWRRFRPAATQPGGEDRP